LAFGPHGSDAKVFEQFLLELAAVTGIGEKVTFNNGSELLLLLEGDEEELVPGLVSHA